MRLIFYFGGIKSKLNMQLHMTCSQKAYIKARKRLQAESLDLVI